MNLFEEASEVQNETKDDTKDLKSPSKKKEKKVKTFENISKQNATTFYSMEKLETSDFNTIYNIMIQSTYIIFIDNSKMIKKSTNKCFFSTSVSIFLLKCLLNI